MQIYDFNLNSLSYKNGSYGGAAGNKDGILINGEEWLLKYPANLSSFEGKNASYSTAPLSEYIGSHIYEILGFDVHETLLGEKNGKIVVACKDFATEKMLLEIRTLKNHPGKELEVLLEGSSIDSKETHVVDLEKLLMHIDKNPLLSNVKGIKQRFFEQAVIDIFINNNDRNNGNWGILREKGQEDCLAPIFDNGASFSKNMAEDKIIRLLNSSELTNNAINVLTAYGEGEHQYSAKTFMKKVENIPEYQLAITNLVPKIQKNLSAICKMIDEIPFTYQTSQKKELLVMSYERKELYKKQVELRLEKLLVPELERITCREKSLCETSIAERFNAADLKAKEYTEKTQKGLKEFKNKSCKENIEL